MARYFFHLSNGHGFDEDQEGHDCEHAQAAREHAIRGLRDALAGDVHEGFIDTSAYIDIHDSEGNSVERIAFHDAVELRSPETRQLP